MKEKKPKKKITESVKLNAEIVDLVRKNKEKTGVAVGRFFEIAAEEKLNKK